MWYIKKAAEKVKTISQNALKEDSQIQQRFKDIISNKNTIMPLKKMADLSSKTYDFNNFEQIFKLLLQKLNDIKFQKKSLKKRLNLLVLVTYLIKHGASGFIDQFRQNIDAIKKYQHLQHDFHDQVTQDLKNVVNEIKQRAIYIRTLLFDKKVLLRQKQLARLIKQKMMTFNGDLGKMELHKTQQEKKDVQQKVEGFLEHYVWRYTNKIDRKLDDLADTIVKKIDEYLDLEIPQSFEIEQVQSKALIHQTKTQCQISLNNVKKKEQMFIKQKNCLQKSIPEQNLLDIHLQLQTKEQKRKNIDLLLMQELNSNEQSAQKKQYSPHTSQIIVNGNHKVCFEAQKKIQCKLQVNINNFQ